MDPHIVPWFYTTTPKKTKTLYHRKRKGERQGKRIQRKIGMGSKRNRIQGKDRDQRKGKERERMKRIGKGNE